MGTFPNSESLRRLATAVLQEQHDEWQDGKRHFSEASVALLSGDGQQLLTNPSPQDWLPDELPPAPP